jgi:hypothetical protein
VRALAHLLVFVTCLVIAARAGFAQQGPRLLEINGFMAKGVFNELDPEKAKHRLSLQEIVTAHLDGKSTDVKDALGFMAKQEGLRFRVDEPLEVRGEIPVTLPPNTLGNEAYTTCYYAFTLNGLLIGGRADELLLMRPELQPGPARSKSQPGGARPKRPWNRNQVLSTRLFRLGYLRPDPILRLYRDQLGTRAGHAVLEPKSNMVIVSDTAEALEKLRAHIDSEILEAMGVSGTQGPEGDRGPRAPSLGAIASPEGIHFYLLAFARDREISLAPSEESGVFTRRYPEADLWTNEQGYSALENEYKRVNQFVRLARQTRGDGWNESDPERTLSPGAQRRLAIHFGVVSPPSAKPNLSKNKKSARKR